jgi:hypothetical protein
MGQGIAGRMRSGAVMASGVLVAVGALTGCGRGTPVGSVAVVAAVSASAVPDDLEAQSPAPVTAAGEINRAAAEAEADRLMTLASVPPLAVEIPSAEATMTAPAVGQAQVDTMVTQARVWRVQLPYAQALAWLRAHPPVGLTSSATGRAEGPGFDEEGVAYPGPSSPAWQSAQLAVSVATVTAKASEIRVDAQVLWLEPTPLPDNRSGPRLHVNVADGCPKSDKGMVGVANSGPGLDTRLLPEGAPTSGLVCAFGGMSPPGVFTLLTSTRLDRTAAARLADQARVIQLGHTNGGIAHCPMDAGRVTLTVFSFPGRDDVDLWSTDGCSSVSNGVISARGQLTAMTGQ